MNCNNNKDELVTCISGEEGKGGGILKNFVTGVHRLNIKLAYPCWGAGNGSFVNIFLNIYLVFLRRKQRL